ncbi:unnamed protein product [Oncorhynchus mykiss]|uniref:Uncharacterized protein n=1 Tax=Oncorhynchus mykiss TaxID=8022 RepID=A0A060YQY2_ONCMY|nr:unnamed protein product [Oncorhynchus mykiss]
MEKRMHLSLSKGSKLLVWDLGGGDCDVIKSTGDIQLKRASSDKADETDSPDALSSLQFVSDTVFLACACNGDLYVGDTRKPSALQQTPEREPNGVWTCSHQTHPPHGSPPPAKCLCLILGNLRAPLSKAQLDVQRKTTDNDFLKVTWAPALDNCLAVSGFDGMVQIYNTASWRPELVEFQPIFVHRGHMMTEDQFDTSSAVVTTHV